MMQASRVTIPSRSGLPPRPTQQFWLASVTITPFSTASRAVPARLNTSQAPLLASTPASQVEITTGPMLFAVRAGSDLLIKDVAAARNPYCKSLLLSMSCKIVPKIHKQMKNYPYIREIMLPGTGGSPRVGARQEIYK